ncbi:MAG TPA: ATP-binding protein [Actinomycetales bacterium]|nr:ATP-binding protein [Actinomycetales bacterium]
MYQRRIVDSELDTLLPELPAIAIDGPKGVGKTETCLQRAATVFRMDDPQSAAGLVADPRIVTQVSPPVLVDEWQHYPPVWDAVRRAVDEGALPGSFLLAGSAVPTEKPTHSGAGRIVSLRMRPMSLAERGLQDATVSIAGLLAGERPAIAGASSMGLREYAREITQSGFPGIRKLAERARRTQLDSYLTRALERDLADEHGVVVRRPDSLRAWLTAYASASSSTASYEAIRAAATPGEAEPPSKTTAIRYRDWLTALWLLDPVPAWAPLSGARVRLASAPKHQLADPALVTRLLNVDVPKLLTGEGRVLSPQAGNLMGSLFESLATLTVRAAAHAAEARVSHVRTSRGEHEVDLIAERYDGNIVAFEVKLSGAIHDHHVKHLHWFRETYGSRVVDLVAITTGTYAYRRQDGVAVVPLALLGE